MAISTAKYYTHNIFILTDSLNDVYLINNHMRHPSSQHHHLNKLFIMAIVNKLGGLHTRLQYKMSELTPTSEERKYKPLVNVGTTPSSTLHIYITHTTLYWLNGIPQEHMLTWKFAIYMLT